MPQDTRKDPRAKVLSLNVRYKSATVDEFIEHHSHDISKGGIFIKTPSPFPAGTLLKFEIRIKEDQPLIAGVGRVVWKREPPQASAERPAGMGVKFIKLDGHSRELIDRIIAERKNEGPAFEETPDGNAPSQRPPAPVAAAAVPADTVSGSGGGAFFPSGPPADQPPPQERTVIKQADEILADALKGAGLGDAAAPAAPIELPKSAPPAAGLPPRKATLLGMPAAPGEGMKLPDEVAAAAKEYEASRQQSEPPAPEPVAMAPVSEPPAPAAEPARPISDRPAARVASEPPRVASDRPAPRVVSEPPPSRRPVAAAAAPAQQQRGGLGGWLIVLVLVAAAGAGGYYLMKGGGASSSSNTAPSASTAASTVAPPATTSAAPTATETAPTATVSAEPTTTAAASASASAAPTASTAAPTATTAAPPATTAAPKPTATAAPPATTAAPKPTATAAPKPPKPPADDNPYQ